MVRELHRAAVENRIGINGRYTNVTIRYQLKNGRKVQRTYTVLVEKVRMLFSQPEYVLEVGSIDEALEKWFNVEVDGQKLSRADGQSLLHAVFADCAAGAMAQNWDFHEQHGSIKVWIGLWGGDRSEYLDLRIFGDAANTIKWLKDNFELWAHEDMTVENYFGSK